MMSTCNRRFRLPSAVAVLCMYVLCGAAVQGAFAQVSPTSCGPIYEQGAFGPYDYRKDKFYLPVVESNHFTPQVEALVRGQTGARVEPDLDYTLRKFPNHHRALAAVLRRSKNLGTVQIPFLPLPVECYFERALRFKSDDQVAHMLYVVFLIQNKRVDEARRQLELVETRHPDNPLTLQNAGLLYVDIADFEKALQLAHRIMQLTPTVPVPLKQALEARGRWRSPEPLPADSAASSPQTSAGGTN